MVAIQDPELLIEETEPGDEEEAQNIRYEIMSFPTDFTVKVMHEKWASSQLVIPDYQRRYVWNIRQASRLIESFLLGLPIPQVFLFREHSNPTLYVVDGHQRLSTIARYYDGQFSTTREFRLTGVNSPWENKSYTELSENDRTTLDDATLRSIVIRQILPNDNTSVYQIFERLNTGGTQLNPMEIRRVIFRKAANKLLDRLNDNSDWRKLIGTAEPDPRYRDVEVVLRVLALSENRGNYRKPMKKFITDYMEILDNLDDEHIEHIEHKFKTACTMVRAQLGEKPFHLRQRLNLAALDAVMASTVELVDSINPDLATAYEGLQVDKEFIETVTHNTSDVSVLQERLKLARCAFTA